MTNPYDEYLEFLKARGIETKKAINPRVCRQIIPKLLEHNPRSILEIGRYKGHSMGLFKYLFPDSIVFSVDIARYQEAVKMRDMFTGCVLIDGDSDKLKQVSERFDLIRIDGDHSYKACKKDWENIQPVMKKGCMVLFDDLGHERGCGRVFYELDEDRYDREIIEVEGIECMGIVRT